MPDSIFQERVTSSAAETQVAGAEFAADLPSRAVVALHGDLGSGKTTFVQGVVAGLGVADEVTSPTFALVHEYGRPTRVVHIDCYREASVDRWLELGIIEYLNSDAICLIEWPETIADILPPETIHLQFEHNDDEHTRTIRREG